MIDRGQRVCHTSKPEHAVNLASLSPGYKWLWHHRESNAWTNDGKRALEILPNILTLNTNCMNLVYVRQEMLNT